MKKMTLVSTMSIPVLAGLLSTSSAAAPTPAPGAQRPMPSPGTVVTRTEVELSIPDVDVTLFTGMNLVVNAKITLPTGTPQCRPTVQLSLDGTSLGVAQVGTTGSAVPSAGGGSTVYARAVAFPQTWEPPKWKAGTYKLTAKIVDGNGCSGNPAKEANLTVKPATTALTVNPPAKGTKGQAFTFTAKLVRPIGTGVPVAGESLTANVCGSNFPASTTNANGVATFTGTLNASCPANPFTVSVTHPNGDVFGHAYAEVKVPLG
ncbi:MAG: hypothetical protein U0169_16025 [Polyangiaceae bacterium]